MTTSQATSSAPNKAGTTTDGRLETLRAYMAQNGLDGLVVRTQDRYLNEYVPPEYATREWLTGFTGSTGDAVVTLTEAYLCVDGRYHLQAEQELTARWSVVKLGLSEPIFTGLCRLLAMLIRDGKVHQLGVESDRTTLSERDMLDRVVAGATARLVPLEHSPLDAMMEQQPHRAVNIRVLDEARLGSFSAEKVQALQDALKAAEHDVMVVQRLDEIAWLCNLRGDELPFQATFKSMAAVGTHGAALCFHGTQPPPELGNARPAVGVVPQERFMDQVLALAGGGRRAAVDASAATDAVRGGLQRAGFTVTPWQSPLADMKAKKNPQEMARMQEAFARADRVVSQCVRWLCTQVARGKSVTEADFARHVQQTFRRSGAVGLSFQVISAAGANGAIIHYTNPDPARVIREGELMLLDTGAYYEEGYATDLTRTFLVGGPKVRATDEQKRVFTLVLRSAIAGMTAVLPQGAPGVSLDAITRKPLWDAGLNYQHGTGHGVGINVHEAPPSINMRTMAPVQANHVFSIEPGVYIAGWGGVRIENLCCAEEHPELQGFLRVRPLTFSPLDARLIEPRLLAPREKDFLRWFKVQARAAAAAPTQ